MGRPLRSARVLALGAGVLAGALAACSLLNGLDADYKLQSGTDDAGRDGNVDPDGPGTDAKTDTSTIDGGPDGPTMRYCDQWGDAGNVTYCCDFEVDTPCLWTFDETVGGTHTLDEGIGFGNSRGLRAHVSTPTPSGRVYYQGRPSPAAFNSFAKHTLSFAFYVKGRTALYGATLGAIGFGSPLKVIGVSVYQADPKDGIDVSDPPGNLNGSAEHVDGNEWRRATITMDRGGDASAQYATTIEVTDGKGGKTIVDQRPFDGGTAPTEILVGAFFTSTVSDGGVDIVIDDVLVTQTK